MGQGPDPAGAHSPAEFVELMRRLRHWADLSFRQLERNAVNAGTFLPRATLSAALSRDELPREELLATYVRACGGGEDTVSAWVDARRRLAISGDGTPPAVPPGALQTAAPQDDDTPPEASQGRKEATDEEPGPSAGPADGPDIGPGGGTTSPPSPWHWRRQVPRVAVTACIVFGVLVLVLWPSDNGSHDRADSPHQSTSPRGTPPSTPSQQPSSSSPTSNPSATAEASASPARHPSPTLTPAPRTAPSTTPKPKSGSAQMPAAGVTDIHPASAPSRCLTEGRERNGRTNRQIAVQHSCADAALPRVSLETVSGQTYRIQWYRPGEGLGCLEVDDASLSPGALLAPRDCTDNDSQKFRLEAFSGGFRLRPVHSDLCVGFLPPVTDGAEALQTDCTGTPDQVFTFTAG